MNPPQISGFEIIESVGTGGMASVWKARQLSLDRIVAIKILSSVMSKDVGDIERFLAEARSAAKLKHPGIIQVYDVNAEEGLYYIVMEYVAGYTVGEWLRRKEVLSEGDALLVVDSVADALDYAWCKEGIIHCDIKPDNVIIDSDGTVKVADLGLARTIRAMSSSQDDEYVMGTPAYMSPEQVRGTGDLDCRADIYSLGAMLYNLVTGKVIFEGYSDNEIMEMQISDAAVEDPLDINPKISKPLCWLIEKMLTKDRDGRQANWAAVRTDISRVKKGRMPVGNALPEGASTVARSKHRTVHDFTQSSTKVLRSRQERSPTLAVVMLILIVSGGVFWWFYIKSNKASPTPSAYSAGTTGAAVPPVAVQTQSHPTEQAAMEMFEFAKKWAGENKDNYPEAVARFEKVAKETVGMKYSLMAVDEIAKLKQDRDNAVGRVINKLQEDAKPLFQNKEFNKAADSFENYNGKFAKETLSRRILMAQDARQKQKLVDDERKQSVIRAEQKMEELLDRVVEKLAAGSLATAYSEVLDAGKDSDLAVKTEEISTLSRLLENAIGMDGKIVDSFSTQVGQDITVNLSSGPVTVRITGISGGKVICVQKFAGRVDPMRPISFDAGNLSAGEKLKRMGQDSNPEVALLKGLIALSSKAHSHAKRYFGKTNPLLGEKLIALAANDEKKMAEDCAERALAGLLRSLGCNVVGTFDKEEWLKAVNAKSTLDSKKAEVAGLIDKYRKDFAGTRFVSQAEDILNIISGSSQW